MNWDETRDYWPGYGEDGVQWPAWFNGDCSAPIYTGTAPLSLGAAGTSNTGFASAGSCVASLGADGYARYGIGRTGACVLKLRALSTMVQRRERFGTSPLLLGISGTRAFSRRVGGTAVLAMGISGTRAFSRRVNGTAGLSVGESAAYVRRFSVSGSAKLSLGEEGETNLIFAEGESTLDVSDEGSTAVQGTTLCGGISGIGLKDYKVTIAGATNGTCSDCANMNGTWTLTYVSGCTWEYSSLTLCGAARTLRFSRSIGNTWVLQIVGRMMQWTVTLGSPWDGVTPLTLNAGFASDCNLPATVTVQPL